jgi:hypothetical protein
VCQKKITKRFVRAEIIKYVHVQQSRVDVRHLTEKLRKSCVLPSAGNGRRSTYTKGINLFILSSQPPAAICNCETLPLIWPTLRKKNKLATNTICSAGNRNQFLDLVFKTMGFLK